MRSPAAACSAVDKHQRRPGRKLHDPTGVWAMFLARPWRLEAGIDPPESSGVFIPMRAGQPACIKSCLSCEECILDPPAPRLLATFVHDKVPDVDPSCTIAVRFAPFAPTGQRSEEIVLAPHVTVCHPIVHEDECAAAFKGGAGTLEEYGRACLSWLSNACPFLPTSSA